MKASINDFENLNKVIQISLESYSDPFTKALLIARESGAFKQSNVVFLRKQLYKINPQDPGQFVEQLKAIKA